MRLSRVGSGLDRRPPRQGIARRIAGAEPIEQRGALRFAVAARQEVSIHARRDDERKAGVLRPCLVRTLRQSFLDVDECRVGGGLEVDANQADLIERRERDVDDAPRLDLDDRRAFRSELLGREAPSLRRARLNDPRIASLHLPIESRGQRVVADSEGALAIQSQGSPERSAIDSAVAEFWRSESPSCAATSGAILPQPCTIANAFPARASATQRIVEEEKTVTPGGHSRRTSQRLSSSSVKERKTEMPRTERRSIP